MGAHCLYRNWAQVVHALSRAASSLTRRPGAQGMPNRWREPSRLEDLLNGDYQTGQVLGEGFGPNPERPDYTYLKGDLTKAYSSKVTTKAARGASKSRRASRRGRITS